jgi:hypothetical protein
VVGEPSFPALPVRLPGRAGGGRRTLVPCTACPSVCQVALEVVGVFGVVRGRGELTGAEVYHKRMLEACGWHVAVVTHGDWEALPAEDGARAAFLEGLLGKCSRS